jgi:hypothetical protein
MTRESNDPSPRYDADGLIDMRKDWWPFDADIARAVKANLTA